MIFIILDSLLNSDWILWNGDGVTPCFINMDCSVKLTLRDSEGNLVNVPQLFTLSDLDSFIVGPFNTTNPHSTLYIHNLDNSQSSNGVYLIGFKRIYAGDYYLYIRFRSEKAPIYPMYIPILTNSVDPAHTINLTPYGN